MSPASGSGRPRRDARHRPAHRCRSPASRRRRPSAGCPSRCRSKRFSGWRSRSPGGASSRSACRRPTSGPAYLDIADHPHAIAVGAPRSGRSNFLRVMCRSITSLYRPEEAQILVLDPRRTLLGVVQGPHLRDYAYTQSAIREAIKELVAELDNRQPPPGTTQAGDDDEDVLVRTRNLCRHRRCRASGRRWTTR